jgi:hypothetical protein
LCGVVACTSRIDLHKATPVVASYQDDPEGSMVTVVRDSGFVGAAVKFDILLDERTVASLWSGEKTSFRVSPGDHLIGITSWGTTDYVIPVMLRTGKSYVYRITGDTQGFRIQPWLPGK